MESRQGSSVHDIIPVTHLPHNLHASIHDWEKSRYSGLRGHAGSQCAFRSHNCLGIRWLVWLSQPRHWSIWRIGREHAGYTWVLIGYDILSTITRDSFKVFSHCSRNSSSVSLGAVRLARNRPTANPCASSFVMETSQRSPSNTLNTIKRGNGASRCESCQSQPYWTIWDILKLERSN